MGMKSDDEPWIPGDLPRIYGDFFGVYDDLWWEKPGMYGNFAVKRDDVPWIYVDLRIFADWSWIFGGLLWIHGKCLRMV